MKAQTIQRILLPIDFSDPSAEAMRYASGLALALGAELDILHVCEMPEYVPPDLAIRAAKENNLVTVKEAMLLEGARKLTQFIKTNALESGPKTTTQTVYAEASSAILKASKHNDLIVIPTHNKGAFDRIFLGSVTEKLVRSSDKPVLTLRPGSSDSTLPKKILVPVDFSETSKSALQLALSLKAQLGASVHLLHVAAKLSGLENTGSWVFPGSEKGPDSLKDWALTKARENLDLFVADIPSEDLSKQIEYGQPHDTILTKAKQGDWDWIVMGTHGRKGLERLFFGSVATRVLRGSPCHVLTVRNP